MRPVPFPEPYRTVLADAGGAFRVFSAPSGDPDDPEVAPVEACSYECAVEAIEGDVREGPLVTSVVIELEDGDLERLQETRMFEFGVWGAGMPVFFFHTLRSPDPEEMRSVPHGFVPEDGVSGEGVCSQCGCAVGHEVHLS